MQPPIVETMFDTATDPLEAAGSVSPPRRLLCRHRRWWR
ncbi:hypothetical protein I552_3186 [Mycobacterium xenopi 3993]|nr:hypothetical protein I552_3186 [Mycobacterium xenopi 3993]